MERTTALRAVVASNRQETPTKLTRKREAAGKKKGRTMRTQGSTAAKRVRTNLLEDELHSHLLPNDGYLGGGGAPHFCLRVLQHTTDHSTRRTTAAIA
jgi:hypothetical protein